MSSTSPSSSPTKPRGRTPGYSKWFIPLHTWLYRRTGGLLGHRLGPQRILLLTTTGRKSGQPRTQPLAYFRDDAGGIYVVASNWGNDAPPAWYLNAQANPHVRVQLRRDTFD